jgi:hypothetical protein
MRKLFFQLARSLGTWLLCGEAVPKSRSGKRSGAEELPILNRQLIIRELEVAFEPLQESWFKDTAASIEGIACEPDQFGLMKSQLFCLLQVFPKLIGIDPIAKAYLDGTIDERKEAVVFGNCFQMNCSISSL